MKPLCELCGEPLPDGEGMFRLHGYSGPCPKPPMPKNPEKEAAYKDLRIAALEAELSRERMRLAACGVVALADTPESAAKAREMHADYLSASCDDVARRVDECISLRADLAQARAECERLRRAVNEALQYLGPTAPSCCGCEVEWTRAIEELKIARKEGT